MQNSAKRVVYAARVRPPFFILIKGDGQSLGPQKQALYLKPNFFFFYIKRVFEALLSIRLVNGSSALPFFIFFLPREYKNTINLPTVHITIGKHFMLY